MVDATKNIITAPQCSYAEDNFVTAMESGAFAKEESKPNGKQIAAELLQQIKSQFAAYSKADVKKQVVQGAKVAFVKDPDMFVALVEKKFFDAAKGTLKDIKGGKGLIDIVSGTPDWQKKIVFFVGQVKAAHKMMLENVDGTMAAYEYQWKKSGKSEGAWEIAKKQLYAETLDKAAEAMAAKLGVPEELLDVEERIAEYESVELPKIEADVEKAIAEVVPEIGKALTQISEAGDDEALSAALANAEKIMNDKEVMQKLVLGVSNEGMMRMQGEIKAQIKDAKYLGIKMYPQTIANAELILKGYDQKGASLAELKEISKGLKKQLTWVNDSKEFEGMSFELGLFTVNTMLLMASAGASGFVGKIVTKIGGKVAGFIAETAAFTATSQASSMGISAMNMAFNKEVVTMKKLMPEGWKGLVKQFAKDLATFGVLKVVGGAFGKAMLTADEVALGTYTSAAKGMVYEIGSVGLSASTLHVLHPVTALIFDEEFQGTGSFLESLVQLGILHGKGLGSKGEKGSLADGIVKIYEKAVIKAGELLSTKGAKKLLEVMPAVSALAAMFVGAHDLISPENLAGVSVGGVAMENGKADASAILAIKEAKAVPEWIKNLGSAKLAALFKMMSSPVAEIDPKERLELYELIPDEIKTELTKILEKQGELWKYFENLSLEDLASPEKRTEAELKMKEWTKLAYEIADRFYLMEGMHPMFTVRRLIQEENKMRDAIIIRMDLDITPLNKADDTGNLGNIYIPLVGEWLSKNIRFNVKYNKFNKWMPTIAYSPERTALLITGTNSAEGRELLALLRSELRDFETEMKDFLKDEQVNGFLDSSLNIDELQISATVHSKPVKLAKLKGMETPIHKVLSVIDKVIAELAAETSWLKSKRPDKVLEIGALKLYDESSLPKPAPDSPLYESLLEFIDSKRGYVPGGAFGFDGVLTGKEKLEAQFPNISKVRSCVSGRFGAGGVVEKFSHALEVVFKIFEGTSSAEVADGKKALTGKQQAQWSWFKEITGKMGEKLANLGEEAKRDPRYPALLKPVRVNKDHDGKYVNSDYFAEQVYLQSKLMEAIYEGASYDTLLTAEVDDGRAFGLEYPPLDKTDSAFQMIKKLAFDAAEELGMFAPIIAAEGDQIRLAISTTKTDGSKITAEAFAKKYQENVRTWYEANDYLFQPTAKVVQTDGSVKRVKVWVKEGTQDFAVADECPAGYVAFSKSLTLSVAMTDMPAMEPATYGKALNAKVMQLFKYIDLKLKKTYNAEGKETFYKQGLGFLPKEYSDSGIVVSE